MRTPNSTEATHATAWWETMPVPASPDTDPHPETSTALDAVGHTGPRVTELFDTQPPPFTPAEPRREAAALATVPRHPVSALADQEAVRRAEDGGASGLALLGFTGYDAEKSLPLLSAPVVPRPRHRGRRGQAKKVRRVALRSTVLALGAAATLVVFAPRADTPTDAPPAPRTPALTGLAAQMMDPGPPAAPGCLLMPPALALGYVAQMGSHLGAEYRIGRAYAVRSTTPGDPALYLAVAFTVRDPGTPPGNPSVVRTGVWLVGDVQEAGIAVALNQDASGFTNWLDNDESLDNTYTNAGGRSWGNPRKSRYHAGGDPEARDALACLGAHT